MEPDLRQRIVQKIRGNIRQYGWAVQGVMAEPDGAPGFCYSIGFTETFGHPEVYTVGFHMDLCLGLINEVGELLKKGYEFRSSVLCDRVIRDFDVAFRPLVPASLSDYNNVGKVVLGKPFEAVQMFLPDPNGAFPWDDDCDPSYSQMQMALFEYEGELPTDRSEPKLN